MKTGKDFPIGEVEFDAPIFKVALGCGFIGVID